MMCDVAIVGFGPTGAVLAGLLGQQGLKVWVCDQATQVYEKPRAIALDHEIMRVFQQLGLLEALTPFVEPFTNSEFYGYYDTCVYDPKLLKVLHERVGADRLVMGSDYPVGEKDPVQWLRDSGLAGSELEAAAGGNAARLLGLSQVV